MSAKRPPLPALLAALPLALFSLGVPTAAQAAASGFADVSADAWYVGSVAYVQEQGLMSGTSETLFSPDLSMSRAMLATTLYRMAGNPAVSGSDSFSDTQDDDWFASAVLWAQQGSYISGYDAQTFGPNDPVTREQLVTILWRYAGSPQADVSAAFTDEGEFSSWAVQAVHWASSGGLVTGRPGNLFDPSAQTTRAETAAILTRYLQQAPEEEVPETETPEPEAPPSETPEAEAPSESLPPTEETPAPEEPEAPTESAPSESETPGASGPPEGIPILGGPSEAPGEAPPATEEPPADGETTLPPAAEEAVPPNQYDSSLFTVENGFLTYQGGTPSYVGVDVSSHQGKIDWQKVAAAGVEFAMIRVGYRGYTAGSIYQDNYFTANITGALEAGLDVGIYFYSQAVTTAEAAEEARQVLEWIEGYDITYPVVFDWERMKTSSSRTKDTTGETITACAQVFCDIIQDAGYTAMVYCNTSDAGTDFYLSQLQDYPFWLAHYTPDWTPTTFPYHYDMWQYSSSGSVDGIPGRVDLNLCLTDW